MPCYSPISGWYSKVKNENGKRTIVFNRSNGYVDMPVDVPCGKCIGCRLEYSRQWAIRCMHEASLYQDNSFITLTYREENLPQDYSLNKKHFQDFMKRLRFEIEPVKIRYFHCGEYGEKCKDCSKSRNVCKCSKFNSIRDRPHYHAIIFNYSFPDKTVFKINNGNILYRSKLLEKVWTEGYSSIGEVTFNSAAYVARYSMKKLNGKKALEDYQNYCDINTGEIILKQSEYATMSRRPGIGKDWYEKFKGDVYPKDEFSINYKKMKPPKYYDNLLEMENEELYKEIKKNRRIKGIKNKKENTSERLQTKESVKKVQIKSLTRHKENSI